MAKLAPRLSPEATKRIVDAAWEEQTPYTKTQMEHGIGKGELMALMRRELTSAAYKQWAAKAKGVKAPTVKRTFPYGR